MYKKHFSNVLGKHGANWSMLLNVIYMVVPLWITKKVLDKPSNLKVKLFILLHDSTIKFVCFSKLSHKFCRNDLILKYWVLWFAALQELSIFHMKWNCFFFLYRETLEMKAYWKDHLILSPFYYCCQQCSSISLKD